MATFEAVFRLLNFLKRFLKITIASNLIGQEKPIMLLERVITYKPFCENQSF